MTDQELEPWPEKVYLLHPSIKTFGAMVSNPERREYVRADRIEELVEERDTARRLLGAATQMQKEAEAKLAEAVEALQFASAELLIIGVMGSYPTALPAANKARTTLAELEGKE